MLSEPLETSNVGGGTSSPTILLLRIPQMPDRPAPGGVPGHRSESNSAAELAGAFHRRTISIPVV